MIMVEGAASDTVVAEAVIAAVLEVLSDKSLPKGAYGRTKAPEPCVSPATIDKKVSKLANSKERTNLGEHDK